MRLRRFVLIAAAIVIAGCTSTASTVRTDYYLVSGTTSEAIDQDLRRKGPMGGHALAVAAIRFAPVSVLQQQTETGCAFTEALFKVEANITLPRWRERSSSRDRALNSAWDALSSYARAHEQQHVRIAERYAERLGETIMALPAQPDCDRLDRSAARVVERIGRQHDRAQLAFDAAERERLERLLRQAEAGGA